MKSNVCFLCYVVVGNNVTLVFDLCRVTFFLCFVGNNVTFVFDSCRVAFVFYVLLVTM